MSFYNSIIDYVFFTEGTQYADQKHEPQSRSLASRTVFFSIHQYPGGNHQTNDRWPKSRTKQNKHKGGGKNE